MFRLSPELQAKLSASRELHEGYERTFSSLSDQDLAASARFWMAHCDAPRRIEPGQPVYDSTFWHVIAPELIRRLAAPLAGAGGAG